LKGINFQDFVTAYSLLGSEWQSNIDYETFRSQYLNIISISIDELKTEIKDDQVLVETVLTSIERTGEEQVKRTYRISYEVAYENDQAKIIVETK
jgi:serine protease Do